MKTQGEIQRRQIVNDFFNRPKNQTKMEFCKFHNIRAYQLDTMIELYGQKITPYIKETAVEYNGCTPSGQRYEYVDAWCEDIRKMIAIEVSDKEYPEYLQNESDNISNVRFERTRLKLLVQIVMMERSQKTLSLFAKAYKELTND